MSIRFLLNGEPQEVVAPPTTTLLDWLREVRGLTGTKEGCNEGDCGACSVIVTGEDGPKALNACILFLPQLHGCAVRTVEGVAGPEGDLHPVQQEMIRHHGSQCGFCTPGFIVTMAASHLNGRTDHDTELAGNLCRCTGYAPILRAAQAAQAAPVPDWMRDTAPGAMPPTDVFRPSSADELAEWYIDHPSATLIAGATDVGLWVTKEFRDLGEVAFLAGCGDLKRIERDADSLRIGAMATMTDVLDAVAEGHPAYAAMIRRYGSVQVRNAATIGGNIANGSPIGDNPPALIAMGARLHLRRGDTRRAIAIEDFFLDYGRQDRAPGEFVEAVTVPAEAPDLAVYKLSKRFDQDISAVCGAFAVGLEDGRVASARIAFGGMAGIPKRAQAVEQALIGAPWELASVLAAAGRMKDDFSPLSDMRASAAYRLQTAENMLLRLFHATTGTLTDLHEVGP